VIAAKTRLAAARRGLKKTPAQYLTENLVVTGSGNFSALAFLCTAMALGVDNALFSVDWMNRTSRQWSFSSGNRWPRTTWKKSRISTLSAYCDFDDRRV
jgi:hypothetical protein